MSKGSGPRPFSVSQAEFDQRWDAIFKKDKDMQVRVNEDKQNIGSCGCGRSPDGKCCGWHGLSEEDYRVALAKYEDSQNKTANTKEIL